jgi:hypothetical protein
VSELKRLLKASTRTLGAVSSDDELEVLQREIESGNVDNRIGDLFVSPPQAA